MNWSSDSHISRNSVTEIECSTDIGILCVCVCVMYVCMYVCMFFNREYEFTDKYMEIQFDLKWWTDSNFKNTSAEPFFSQIVFTHIEVQLEYLLKVNMEMVMCNMWE
jgi:hypothetical protein